LVVVVVVVMVMVGSAVLSSGQLLLSLLLLCNDVHGVSTLELAPQHSTIVATKLLASKLVKS
jgi:hypothetical protein